MPPYLFDTDDLLYQSVKGFLTFTRTLDMPPYLFDTDDLSYQYFNEFLTFTWTLDLSPFLCSLMIFPITLLKGFLTLPRTFDYVTLLFRHWRSFSISPSWWLVLPSPVLFRSVTSPLRPQRPVTLYSSLITAGYFTLLRVAGRRAHVIADPSHRWPPRDLLASRDS